MLLQATACQHIIPQIGTGKQRCRNRKNWKKFLELFRPRPAKVSGLTPFFMEKDGGEALTVRVKVITGHYLQLLYDGIKENRENLSNENEQTFTGLATRC
jgi:hypothetical protein